MAHLGKTEPAATALTEEQRQSAMDRFAVLRPHLEEDVPLAQAARHAGVSVRTAEREPCFSAGAPDDGAGAVELVPAV